jgi:c-di-GMP-binding flagellar brake protein YcgR
MVRFMGAPTKALPEKQDKQGLQLDTGRRRSMRVLLSVPIHVTGKTKDNQKFEEETRTLVVNAHGALISLAAKLVTGQQVSVNNRATQKSMNCRVVYVGNPAAGKMQMGVEFVEPCPSFWQIDFPPDDWVVPEN